ncbi:hypothetical protein RhiJN_07410 [Ceratobasidium sp. AG-Ba]|nr:hypothetical protein RhiJN_07410 [Ceratobasidium sp. AG-Ba]
MGVLALGALGAMLPGVLVHPVDTHSLVVGAAVVAVVLILAYVTNPSAASFRTFLTELAFRKHLSKLHDATESESPAVHWARHSHQIDDAPHLQFATRASVSVRSSAHIFRSFGVLTIAAVTPVADQRTNTNDDNTALTNAFASDHGRWFLGAFGKWWLGGTLFFGKSDGGYTSAGLLDIRLLDESELLKWKVVPDTPTSRTPPPLPKHASLPLHTNTKQQKHPSPKRKVKTKPENTTPASVTTNPTTTPGPNANIDAHPLITDLLQHIATTQNTLSDTRAQLAQLHASTAQTQKQTEEHAAQRTKHNSASAGSDAIKAQTQRLNDARRTHRASGKALATVEAKHTALEQKAAALTKEANSLRDRVLRDQQRVEEGEEKGRIRREEVVELIGLRKEEIRKVEEELTGTGGNCPNGGEERELVGLVGKVRALEAEVREAKKTLEELKALQASLAQEEHIDDQDQGREIEHEKEKEPGVVYIGQTPVRAPSLSNASLTNPARIHNPVVPHTRTGSAPVSGLLSHAIHSSTLSQNTSATPAPGANHSPTPANATADVSSPARSARNKGYAIFDNDLASLGASAGRVIQGPVAKGAMGGPDSNQQAPSNPSPSSIHQVSARPTFSPFDSDTLPIPIPKRASGGNYALVSGEAGSTFNPNSAGQGKFDTFGLELAMDSPTTAVFSPPPSALLPSSLFSEDGQSQRWDETESNGQFANSTSPGQLIGSQFGSSPGQLINGSSPGRWANGTSPSQWNTNGTGTSPARWEKDADGWVNEAKSVTQGAANGWEVKPVKDSSWVTELDGWGNSESRRRWTGESSTNGVWVPRTEGGRPRSVSVESRFDAPVGRPRSDSHDGHRLSAGADSGYHTATNNSHPKKRNSGSSSGSDVAQDGFAFVPPFLQHSPVNGSADSSISSFGQGVFGPSNQLSNRRGFDAQRVSLAARVPLIREVEEPEPARPATTESAVVVTNSPKARRWFSSVGGAKKDEGNPRVQGSGLNPDAKVFSFTPDASKMFNFTRGRTFNLAPPAPESAPAPSFSSLSLGSANSSTVALGNGTNGGGGSSFFSSLLAFAPSPAEREALQRALGTNGITRTLSNTSARSPFTSPLASARSSTVDLNDKAALAWGNSSDAVTPVVQKRTWFPVRKKAAAEEVE